MTQSLESSAPSSEPLALVLRRTIDEHIGATAVGAKRALSFQNFLALIARGLSATGIDQSAFEPAVAAAEQLFDQFVAPFDIPGVPNFLEPMVDAQLKRMIRPILKAFFDAIPQGS